MFPSQRKFAKAIGVSEGALRKYLKRSDWPDSVPNPMPKLGWTETHVTAINHWRTGLQENRAAELAEAAKEKKDAAVADIEELIASGRLDGLGPMEMFDKLVKRGGSKLPANLMSIVKVCNEKAKLEKLQLDNEIKTGQFVKSDLVDGMLGGLATAFVQILDDLELSVPIRFANKTEAEINRDFGPLLDAMRQQLCEKARIGMVSIEEATREAMTPRRT